MSFRARIFLLSTAMTILAIAAMGGIGLVSARSAIVSSSLDKLERELSARIAALDGSRRALPDIDENLLDGRPDRRETVSDLRNFLVARGAELLGREAELEIRLPSGERLFILGELNAEAGLRGRPEFESALEGPAYVIRRLDSGLTLYYAAAATILGVEVLACAATGLDSLDSFQSFYLGLLAAASAIAAGVLLAASYFMSRLIARKLDEGFKRMSESIRDKVDRLEADKADRQAFIDDLTHELRTPVTSIVGFAELLRSRSWDEKVFAEGLERIEIEGKRILELSESLKRLLVARTGARDLEEVEASAFLESVAADRRSAAAAACLDLKIEADEGRIRLDPSLMSIALRNLIDNSIRASVPGSEIALGFSRNGDARRLYVRDPGPGMADAQIARAGRPFPRPRIEAREGGGGHRGGLGLGLAICKEIAESHGAVMAFERPEGGGFLVAIDFPNLPPVYAGETAT